MLKYCLSARGGSAACSVGIRAGCVARSRVVAVRAVCGAAVAVCTACCTVVCGAAVAVCAVCGAVICGTVCCAIRGAVMVRTGRVVCNTVIFVRSGRTVRSRRAVVLVGSARYTVDIAVVCHVVFIHGIVVRAACSQHGNGKNAGKHGKKLFCFFHNIVSSVILKVIELTAIVCAVI